MLKNFSKLIILFFLLIFTLCPKVLAEDVFRITSANFDTSNAMVVISALDGTNSQIMPEIKLVELSNPKRIYFDINSAVLSIPKQEWAFNSQGIKQIKISQFSTKPNTVRVVMYLDDNFSISNIKFTKMKNNIILRFKDSICENSYYQNTYRDEHSSSSDFYEYLSVSVPTSQDLITNQIQEAFDSITAEKKELKLNTKYYIDKITIKQKNILINGFGSASIEKPMILTNPSRIVFDMPNTLVSPLIRNNEYKINDTDTAKIGQFSVNKARIVIQTNNVEQYIPIYSSDNQSLLIANRDKIDRTTLYANTNNMIAYSHKKSDKQTDEMILTFNHPLIHGVDRLNDKLVIYFYNTLKYNQETFQNSFSGTPFANAEISLMPNIGMIMVIPVEQNTLASTYFGIDGKAVKISLQAPAPKTEIKKETKAKILPIIPKSGISRRIVLDAGHGGSDYGAIRNDVNEKDINLDITKRVQKILENQGYTVIMTRDNDSYVSLEDRVQISESSNPDVFVSIHVNSSTKPEITGIETHYYHQESLNLAQTTHAALASSINSKDRGLFKSKFYVINHTTAPSILVEIGFLSNDNERAELVGEKRKADTAKAIADGINNYYKKLK